MLLILDSTFLIDHLRGLPEAVARWRVMFEQGDIPVMTAIAVAEVRTGLLDAAIPHFEALLQPMELVQPGLGTAMLAGQWRAELRTRGRTLSLADALIAASAFHLQGAVLTRNVRDFALTPVRVATY